MRSPAARIPCVGLIILLVSGLLGNASRAAAQGTAASIIGEVTDDSGGMLPGVNVTASSPALQVPQITVMTNERGEYRLAPLPIGTYTVKYELQGFQTVQREGIRLTVGFVSKVDIAMKVGALEESVTVTGAAPVVDVSSTSTRTQFVRETLEELPTTRNGLLTLMVQAPGVRTSAGGFDVGGSQFTSPGQMNSFGRAGDDWRVFEGVNATANNGSGTGAYQDFSSMEEAVVQTMAKNAEVPWSGVYVNTLLKTGGNDYHGSGNYYLTGPKLQQNNVDSALEAQGIRRGSTLLKRYDFNGDVGGRIIRDKLWFYAGGRRAWDDSIVVGSVKPDGSPGDALVGQEFWTAKVSYQMTPGHKIIGFNQWNWKYNTRLTRFNSWESRVEQDQTGDTRKIEWQGIFGNSVSVSALTGYFDYGADIVGFAKGQVATFDQVTLRYTGDQVSSWPVPYIPLEQRYTTTGTLSWFVPEFFGAAHEIKTGGEYLPAMRHSRYDARGSSGDYMLVFRSGLPFQVTTFNSPTNAETRTMYSGAYVQDNIRFGRLSLNLGLRFDHSDGYNPEQSKGAGTFSAAQTFPRVQFRKWTSIAPRLYFAWDISKGDRRTAIKGGWGRFNKARLGGDVEPANSAGLVRSTWRWNDANNNLQWDQGEVNLDPAGPDFVSVQGTVVGSAAATRMPNPNERQPITDEFSGTVEHELFTNMGARVSGVYARDSRLRRLDYVNRPASAYNTAIVRPDPGPDGRVGTADDPGANLTYYEYPTSFQGPAFDLTWASTAPGLRNDYKALEFALSKRSSNNWQLMASYGRIWKDLDLRSDLALSDPNSLLFADDRTSSWYAKIGGSYRFPRLDVLTSANWNAVSGEPYSRRVSLTGGRTVTSIVIPVEPWGTRRYENAYLLDLRLEKRVKIVGQHRLAIRADVFNALNSNVVTTLTTQSGASFGAATAIMPARITVFSFAYTF
jgi:hypothetical protein